MKVYKHEQGSEEWFAVRLGKLTASNAQAIATLRSPGRYNNATQSHMPVRGIGPLRCPKCNVVLSEVEKQQGKCFVCDIDISLNPARNIDPSICFNCKIVLSKVDKQKGRCSICNYEIPTR